MQYVVMAYAFRALVMSYVGRVHMVMAYIAMADIVMAYIIRACVARLGLCSYGASCGPV